MQAASFENDIIMRIIIEVYDAMDEHDIATWSRREAEKVVADQILMDRRHGLDPLPYEAEDFYDTIRELIRQDYDWLYLLLLRVRSWFRR